jgi:hypothetical protein
MQRVIDLHVLDQILSSTPTKLSAISQALYMNCLMQNFRKKESTPVSALAFEIGYTIAKFDSFKKQYDELQQAGLISYTDQFIRFENVWSKHIDPRRYDEQPLTLLPKTFDTIVNQLRENNSGLDLIGMRMKISRDQVNQLLEIFILEQIAVEKKYIDMQDCYRHFFNWAKHGDKKDLVNKSKSSANGAGKILGLNK